MQEMIEQFNSIKAKMKADGEQLVGAYIKELMAEHPKIAAVKWTQYTPYFNDGDPCVFGVNEADFRFVGAEPKDGEDNDSSEEDDDEAGWFSSWSPPYGFKGTAEAFQKAIGKVPDEMMLAAFGDHVRVTVTRDGDGVSVEVDEYEHD